MILYQSSIAYQETWTKESVDNLPFFADDHKRATPDQADGIMDDDCTHRLHDKQIQLPQVRMNDNIYYYCGQPAIL